MEKTDEKNLSKFQYIVFYFILYAFIGWLLETAYAFYVHGHFVNRGFLLGPLCPIYGFGAVLLLIVLDKYKTNSLKLFAYSAILFSVFEYVASFLLETLFQLRWWDYTGEFLNLNGRISIFFSFVWGVIAILLINNVHPFLKEKTELLLKKVPYLAQSLVLKTIFGLFVVDIIISCARYLELINFKLL